MDSTDSPHNDFLKKLQEITEANLTNPQFGVSMLARELGISRVTLHRKVNTLTKITVSQFINHIRLKKAKEILRHTSKSVSETAYEVGFNNVSYFIKCFHEYYGYSPGEVGNREEEVDNVKSSKWSKKQIRSILVALVSVIVLAVVLYIVSEPFQTKNDNLEKSIAVLLPYYHISDSSNYIIDGIAEAVYSKLQLVGDLTVRPWTSVIKYRDSNKAIPEIAKELKVNYIVEFICQNFSDNEFNITVSLINAAQNSPTPLGNFKGTLDDIDTIEKELSSEVAREIDANITPEENVRMKKVLTSNKTARRYYLQGLQKQNTDVESAISFFKKAVDEDTKFALAYAQLADTYSLLDTGKNEGNYADTINYFADQAILFDNENDKCLIAKAKILISQRDYEPAINYLQKAIEYNPNSAISYRLLSDACAQWGIASTAQYLEYALKSVKYNVLETDSWAKSVDYNRLARALRGTGFYNEALNNIERALDLFPASSWHITEKCEILMDSTGLECDKSNYLLGIRLLNEKFENDNTDILINAFLLQYYYCNGDFQNAYKCYNGLDANYQVKEKYLSRYAVVLKRLGMQKESDNCIEQFEKLKDNWDYGDYFITGLMIRLYCLKNDTANAMKELQLFGQQDYLFGNNIRQLKDEPIFENLHKHPDFNKVYSAMKTKFFEDRKQIRKSMQAKGLM